MKLNFTKKEENRSNKVYLEISYMSGDADAFEIEEQILSNLDGDDLLALDHNQIEILKEHIKPYAILQDILENDNDYDEILDEYGEEVAGLYDNTPGDCTVDGQWKSKLDGLTLKVYSSDGSLYESYIDIDEAYLKEIGQR